jgi:hypothetical protein
MPVEVVSAVVPTLTTTLRAVRGLALVGTNSVVALQAGVGASSGHQGVHAGRRLRLPVERDVADGDRAARACAQPHQLVLDAEAGQPVTEVADRLVVVKTRL